MITYLARHGVDGRLKDGRGGLCEYSTPETAKRYAKRGWKEEVDLRPVMVDTATLPQLDMTDDEAFLFHEQQAVRHMELAKQFADKLGKEYK